MNTCTFRTEGGGLIAALARRVYYTGKNLHATDGSRTAITTGPSNGAVLCFDPHAHEADSTTIKGKPGLGEIVTQPEDDGTNGDNRSMIAGFAVGLRGVQSEAGWIDVIPPVRGIVHNPLTKAANSFVTPTYLGAVDGEWELGVIDPSTAANNPRICAVSMTGTNTSSTAARTAVCFI